MTRIQTVAVFGLLGVCTCGLVLSYSNVRSLERRITELEREKVVSSGEQVDRTLRVNETIKSMNRVIADGRVMEVSLRGAYRSMDRRIDTLQNIVLAMDEKNRREGDMLQRLIKLNRTDKSKSGGPD